MIKLNPSEQSWYQAAFELSPIGISLVAPDGRWLKANQALCQMFGYSSEELQSLRFQDITHPDDLAADLEHTQRMFDGELSSMELEKRYIRKDGRVLWAKLNTTLVRDVLGQPEYFITQIQDIGEKKQFQSHLEVNRQLLDMTLASADIGTWSHDFLTGKNTLDQTWATMLGYTLDEVEQSVEFYESLLHPEDLEANRRVLQEHLRGENALMEHVARLRAKDGSWRWILSRGKVVEWIAPGQPLRTVGTHVDITRQKEIERALWAANSRLDYLLQSNPATLYTAEVVPPIYKTTFMSENIESLLGYSSRDFVGAVDFWANLIHPDDRDRVIAELAQIPEQDSLFFEYRMLHVDGSYRWLMDKCQVMRNELGAPIEMIGFLIDVTDLKQAEHALQATSNRLNFLLKSTPVTLYASEVFPPYRTTFMSENVQNLMGYSAQEYLSTPNFWRDHIHPEDRERVIAESLGVAELPSLQLEYRFRHADGNYRWVFDANQVMRDAEGKPIEAVGYWVDITERKQAEEALRKSEEKYRMLFEGNPHPMYVFDRETHRFLAVNDVAIQKYGYSREEFLSLTVKDIRPQEDIPRFLQTLKQIRPTVEDAGLWRHYTKDGTLIDVEVFSHTIEFEGRLANLVLVNDVTSSKQAQEQIRYQANLIESVSDAIVSGDLDFNVRSWNKAAETICGWKAEEAVGRYVGELNPWELSPEEEEAVLEKFLAEGFWHGEVVQKHKNGNRIHNLVSMSLLRDELGNPTGFVSVNRDITERKQAEEALRAERDFAQQIMNAMGEGLSVTNVEDCLEYVNPAQAAMIGVSPEDMVGHHPTDFVVSGDIDQTKSQTLQRSRGLASTYEIEMRHRDGRPVPVRVHSVPHYKDGKYAGSIAVISDLTEQKRAEQALRAERDFAQQVMSAMGEGLVVTDAQDCLEYLNPALAKILGNTPEQLLGHPVIEFVAPNDSAVMLEEVNRRAIGVASSYEVELTHSSGYSIPVGITSVPRFSEGKYTGAIGVVSNLTERKQAEQKQKELTQERDRYYQRLQLMLDNMPIGCIMNDADFNVIYWNSAAQTIFGFAAEEILGQSPYGAFIPCEVKPYVEDLRQKMVQEKAPTFGQNNNLTKDGRTIFCEWTNTPMFDAEGHLVGFLSMVQDATARKQAEEQLVASEAKYRSLIESLDSGIAMIDAEGTYRYLNQALADRYGWDIEEIVGKSLADILPPDFAAYRLDIIRQVIENRVGNLEESSLELNGQTRWFSSNTQPIRDAAGRVSQVLVNSQEITARKQTEQELERIRTGLEDAQSIARLGSWESDEVAKTVYWSREMYALFERDPNLGAPEYAHFMNYVRPEDRQQFIEGVASLKTKNTVTLQVRINPELGPALVIQTRIRAIRNEAGKIIRLAGTCLDITELKQAEEGLLRTRASLEEAQAIARLGNWEIDVLKHQTKHWSKQMYELFERDLELGVPSFEEFFQMVNPLDISKVQAAFSGATRAVSEMELEFRTQPASGQVRHLQIHYRPIKDSSGRLVRMVGTALDITELKQAEEGLLRTRASLEEAQAIARLGNWEIDVVERHTLYWSKQMFELYRRDPALGAPGIEEFLEYIHPEDVAAIRAAYGKVLQNKESLTLDFRTHPALGQERFIQAQYRPVLNDQGRVVRVVGTALDITERKHFENRLLATQATLEEAQALVRLGNWEIDIQLLRVTHWSKQMYELYGLDPKLDAPTFEEYLHFVHPEDLTRLRDVFLGASENTLEGSIEFRIRTVSGQERYILAHYRPTLVEAGFVVRFSGTALDITERKIAEEKLRQSESLYRGLIESSNAVIATMDADGRYYFVNQIGASTVGLEATELIGKHLQDFYSPEDTKALIGFIREVLETNQGLVTESQVQIKGEVRWMFRNFQPIRDASGRAILVMLNAQDITERKAMEEKLRESESLYRGLIQSSNAVIATADIEGRYHYVNQIGAAMLGLEPEDMIGRSLWEFFPAELVEAELQILRKVIQDNTPVSFESPGYRDNELFWQLRNYQPIRDASGRAVLVMLNAQDITERKFAETKLQQSEALYRTLVESSNSLIATIDAYGVFYFANALIGQQLGVDPDDLVGRKLREFLPGNVVASPIDLVQKVLEKNQAFVGELPIPIKGEVRWFLVNLLPIPDSSGKSKLVMFNGQDITQRKLAEERLQNSEAKYRSLIESSDSAIATLDINGKFHYANRITAERYGVSPEEVVGKNISDFLTPERVESRLELFKQIYQTSEGIAEESAFVSADETRWYLNYLQPIRDLEGRVSLILLNSHDITERKQIEEKLQQSEAQYRSVTESSSSIIATIDSEGYFHFANRLGAGRFGLEPSGVIGKHITHFFPEQIAEGQLRVIRQVLQTNQGFATEIFTPINGQLCWLMINLQPIQEVAGQPKLVVLNALDITERKLAEEKLLESEELFSKTFYSSPIGKVLFSIKTQIIRSTNNAMSDICGRSQDDLVGKKIANIGLRLDDEDHKLLQKELLESGQLHNKEMKLKRFDGEVRDVMLSFALISIGGELHTLALIQDITVRKQAEETVRFQKTILEETGRIAKVGGWSLNVLERTGFWTDEIARIHDLDSGHSITPDTGLDFYTPESRPVVEQALQEAIQNGTPYDLEVEIITAKGVYKSVRIIGHPVVEQGKTVTLLGTIQDITDRKRIEDELRRIQTRLEDAQTSARLGSWEYDAQTQTMECSKEFFALLEYDPNLGQPTTVEILEYIHPDDRRLMLDMFTHIGNEGSSVFDCRTNPSCAPDLVFEVRARAIKDAQGNLLRVTGTCLDITERKFAEEELRLSNVLLTTQQETSIDGILVVDDQNRILEYNSRFVDLWHVPGLLLVARDDSPVLHFVADQVVDSEAFIERARHLYFTRQETSQEEIELKDGRIFERYSSPMLGPDGRYFGRVWYFRDITERKQAEEELKKIRDGLEEAQSIARLGSWEINPTTLSIDWSNEMFVMLGLDPSMEPPTLSGFAERIHLEDRERVLGLISSAFETGEGVEFEARVNPASGLTKLHQTRIRPEKDLRGNVVRLRGTSLDVTERRQAEEQVRYQASLIESVSDAVISTDKDFYILSWNKAAETVYGWKAEEVVGKLISEVLVDTDTGEQTRQSARNQVFTEGYWQNEVTQLHRNGRMLNIFTSVTLVHDEAGNPTGVVAVNRDITERRQAERALLTSEALLREAQRAARLGSWHLDLATGGMNLSEELCAIAGISYGEYDNLPAFFSIVHPEDRARVEEASYQQAMTNREFPVEFRIMTPGGDEKYILSHSFPVTDAEGRVIRRFGTFQDITERVQIEKARRDKERAEAANQAKSEFLSRMSHELRTPLNSILGFAQLLELDIADSSQQQSLKYILSAGKHLLQLINELLDISRIESGRLSLSLEPVLLEDLVFESVDLVRPLATARGIEIKLDEPGAFRVMVLADRQRLKQVLFNLLSNAIKYNREGGTVQLLSVCSESVLRLSVIDRGMGIPPEKMQRLFTPFDRLGAQDGEGTGLGLALSKRLMEAMNGKLGVKSTVNQGSTFWIELPEAMAAIPASKTDVLEVTGMTPIKEGHTILYIEDNVFNLHLIENILMRQPNINLLAAMQGGLGLEMAFEHRPDLILLDLHLPDIFGQEVLSILKSDDRTRHIPVIILSADASPQQIDRLLANGAIAYLPKPLDVAHLLETLQANLKQNLSN